jgi:hypothetical protein
MVSGGAGKDQYCRDVEAYLCRRNEGHLIRIVGPAFELVCGWADRGIPLQAVCRGIDRYVERQQAKTTATRRRPARVEFCEDDVLDAFDEWRRAVGVTVTSAATGDASDPAPVADEGYGQRGSLAAHLQRAIAVLEAARASAGSGLRGPLGEAARELSEIRPGPSGLRGAARQQALERLRQIDSELMAAIRMNTPGERLSEIATEADEQLAPFKGRMPEAAYRHAREACEARLLRERAGLPAVAFE